jgi:hypothetical protein
MTGTREMSGSEAIRFRNFTMAALESSMGLVHVDVDDLRAVLHLLARHGQRLVVLLVQDQARKGLGTGNIRAFADVDEQRAFADGSGSRPESFMGGAESERA